MIVVVDNYDSFTYNLVQYLWELGAQVEVYRNDELKVNDIAALKPQGIVLSPGPGRPEDAGITMPLIKALSADIPIFGVCLGHQAMAACFGAQVVGASNIMHGRTSTIQHDAKGIFEGLPQNFQATRYHSLIVEPKSLPSDLMATAWTEAGELMGLRHRTHPLEGVQFHPESFLTEHGHHMLGNFLKRTQSATALSKTG